MNTCNNNEVEICYSRINENNTKIEQSVVLELKFM